MTGLRFYLAWLKLGRAYWKAQKEIEKLEEDCLRWATLAAYLNPSVESVADEVAVWLAEQDEDAA